MRDDGRHVTVPWSVRVGMRDCRSTRHPVDAVPELATGDLVAMAGTGAYTFSLASNYNATPRPAVVEVTDGRAHTPDDEIYPTWLGDSIGFWNKDTLVIWTTGATVRRTLRAAVGATIRATVVNAGHATGAAVRRTL